MSDAPISGHDKRYISLYLHQKTNLWIILILAILAVIDRSDIGNA